MWLRVALNSAWQLLFRRFGEFDAMEPHEDEKAPEAPEAEPDVPSAKVKAKKRRKREKLKQANKNKNAKEKVSAIQQKKNKAADDEGMLGKRSDPSAKAAEPKAVKKHKKDPPSAVPERIATCRPAGFGKPKAKCDLLVKAGAKVVSIQDTATAEADENLEILQLPDNEEEEVAVKQRRRRRHHTRCQRRDVQEPGVREQAVKDYLKSIGLDYPEFQRIHVRLDQGRGRVEVMNNVDQL